MNNIGDLSIETVESSALESGPSIEIDSPEALMQHGKKRQSDVRAGAQAVREDTLAELNSITGATRVSPTVVSALRDEYDVDNKLKSSLERVTVIAQAAENDIAAAASR